MYFVYVLEDSHNGRLYIGRSDTLERRMGEHDAGKVRTTRRMNEPKLVFYEAFKAKEDAIRREQYFKTTKGRSTLRLMLRAYLERDG